MESVASVLGPQSTNGGTVYLSHGKPYGSSYITDAGTLDLDYFSSHLGGQSSGKGLGYDGACGDDSDPLEGTKLLW